MEPVLSDLSLKRQIELSANYSLEVRLMTAIALHVSVVQLCTGVVLPLC